MKPLLTYFIVFVSAMLLAQNINMADCTYSVVFEDTTLNANMKTNIVEDLTRYLAYVEKFEQSFYLANTTEEGTKVYYSPNPLTEVMQGKILYHVNSNTTNLFVSTARSEFYKSQYTMLNNCGISNSYERACEFVNSINTGSITNKPISEQIQFLQQNPHKSNTNNTQERLKKELDGLSEIHFYPVSIAGFLKAKIWGEDEYHYLFVLRIKLLTPREYQTISELPIVYHDNRWSLLEIEFTP